MKRIQLILISILIPSSFFLTSCKKEDSFDSGSGSNNNSITASCSDGIQNQNETGVDCGGVCAPCSSTSSEISFAVDGTPITVTQLNAYRTTTSNPTSITIIAVTDVSSKLTIYVEEPDVSGWSGGLSFTSLTPPNMVMYEVTDASGTPTTYSSVNGTNDEELSFLFLEYKVGGRLDGKFSGVLEDGNGNTISITAGDFDSTFDD